MKEDERKRGTGKKMKRKEGQERKEGKERRKGKKMESSKIEKVERKKEKMWGKTHEKKLRKRCGEEHMKIK